MQARDISWRTATAALLCLCAMLVLCACSGAGRTQVTRLPNGGTMNLAPDDVIRLMQRTGFSDDQIVQIGPDLYEGLAQTGAVQIRVGPKVEAIFLVDGQCVIGTSRKTGHVTYDTETAGFR